MGNLLHSHHDPPAHEIPDSPDRADQPRHSLASPNLQRIGACAPSPKRRGLPKAPFIACSNSSVCSLTAPAASSSRPIPSLSRSCATWSGSIFNPPDKAVVLCVGEKSQIQALERTQPMLPMGFGYIEGVTHDYQVTARPPCSRPSTCSTAQSSLNVNPAIATRSSSHSCVTSSPMCRPNWPSISSSTTTPPTRSQGRGLARPPSALAHSLHANLRLLA